MDIGIIAGILTEFFAAILFIFINYLLLHNVSQVKRIGLVARSATWHDHVLTVGLLWWAQIVSLELLLGFLGWLRFDVAVCVVALVNLALRLAPARALGAPQQFALPLNYLKTFTIERGLLVVGGGVILMLAGINAVTPPVNWDSLTYHLTFPVEWYQHARLNLVPTAYYDFAPTFYPINVELVFLWLLLPFNSLFIPDLGQSIFVLGALIGIYGLSRKLGLSARSSLGSVLLCMSIPMLLIDGMLWSYSDVGMAAAFIIALYFCLSLLNEFTLSRSLTCGIALGLLIGTKSPALVYSIPLGVWLSICIAKKAWRARALVKFGASALWILPVAVFGLHTYVRNWLVTGNPFFPLSVNFMGNSIWRGYVTMTDYASVPFNTFDAQLLVVQPGYFPHWAFTLIAIMFGLYQTRAMPGARERVRWLVLLWGILCVLFYLFMPLHDVRYLLPVQLVGSLIVAISFTPLRRIWQVLIVGAHCFFGWAIVLLEVTFIFGTDPMRLRIISNIFNVQEWIDYSAVLFSRTSLAGMVNYGFLVAGGTVLIAIAARSYAWIFTGAWRRWALAGIAGILVVTLSLAYDVNEYAAYQRYFDGEIGVAWAWLNEHTLSERIANVGNNVPLPLYGNHLKNRVFIISDNERLAVYGDSNINPRPVADYDMWFKNLSAEQVSVLFITAKIFLAEPTFDMEDHWASIHPGEFALWYATNRVHIWRVISQPAAE